MFPSAQDSDLAVPPAIADAMGSKGHSSDVVAHMTRSTFLFAEFPTLRTFHGPAAPEHVSDQRVAYSSKRTRFCLFQNSDLANIPPAIVDATALQHLSLTSMTNLELSDADTDMLLG